MMAKAKPIQTGNTGRKLVLMMLADIADDHGQCFPSYQHLADVCEMSKRSVIRHISDLEEQSFVIIEHRKGLKFNKSNVYTLNFSSDTLSPPSDTQTLPSDTVSPPPSDTVSPITYHSSYPINEPITKQTPPNPQGGRKTKIRVAKPDSFKALFALYPSHRKGGTDAQAWKTWTSEKLTDHDAGLACHWLTQASSTDPANWSITANGFAYGITKFIRERIWLTPAPTVKAGNADMGWDDITWADSLEEVL